MNKSKCPVEDCPRKIDKEGLCIPHREERNKELGIECGFVECDRGATKAGLCNSHYSQKKNGKELTPLRKRRPQQSGAAECGTRRAYELGCRCAECREAKRIDTAEWRAKYKQKHGRGYYGGRERNRTTYDRVCEYCGADYQTRTYIARYCSSTCGVRDKAGWSKSREVMLWTRPYEYKTTTAPLNILPKTWTYTTGNCSICGKAFVSKYMNVTCSDECQRKHERERKHRAGHRRRARKKEAFVENVYRKRIFERDGYKCHICGKRTNPNAAVPSPKAPTLDHIIPLASGGTHEPSNVATAHFICNSRKAHIGTGDQLLLFG